MIRLWEVDPHTRKRIEGFDLPFQPGTFEWGPGKPRAVGLAQSVMGLVSFNRLGSADAYQDVLSQPGDPFRFVVKEFLPASAPAVVHVADPDGAPTARLELHFKAPDTPQAQDGFRFEEDHWFATERKFYRVVRSQRPALIAFSYVDRPELVEDFLKPPTPGGGSGVAGSAIRITRAGSGSSTGRSRGSKASRSRCRTAT